MLHSGALRLDAHATSFIEDLRRMSLVVGEMPTGCPVIPPSGTMPLAGSRSISLTAGSMLLQTFPYGPNTAAQQYTSSVSANMGIYGELSRHHLHSVLNLVASTLASKYQDSTRTPGMERRAIASHRYDPRDRRPHMHPSYYYFGSSDSDSADDSYDLTCECFHIDGAIM
jgi:hypothetical protein